MSRDLDRILKEKRELEQEIGKKIWEFENRHDIVGTVDERIEVVRNPPTCDQPRGVVNRASIKLVFEEPSI